MAANCRWTVVWRKSEERAAFRAGIPLGALSLGKLIPIFGVSIAIAGFGLSLFEASGACSIVRGWNRLSMAVDIMFPQEIGLGHGYTSDPHRMRLGNQ
jgi:hypothetical protein